MALKKKDFFWRVDNLIQDYPKGDVGEIMRMRCALEKLWMAYNKALNTPAGLEDSSLLDKKFFFGGGSELQTSAYQANKAHCRFIERLAADLLECHRQGYTKRRRVSKDSWQRF